MGCGHGIRIELPRIGRKIALVILLAPAWSVFAFSAVAYGQPIEWDDEGSFTGADRKAIPALAKIMGLRNPKRIWQGNRLPSLCPYAMVESAYSEKDRLRTYLQLTVHRKDWKCTPEGERSKRVGRWLAYSTELETWREWKIQEDQWVRYIPVADGVSYADAQLIILAFKHRQLVNRVLGSVDVPTIDPAEVTSIRVLRGAGRTFEVWSSTGGSGAIYVVKITHHIVELHELRFWIA